MIKSSKLLNLAWIILACFCIGCDLERDMGELNPELPSQEFTVQHGTDYHWKVKAVPNKHYELILTLKSDTTNGEATLWVNREAPCSECHEYVVSKIRTNVDVRADFIAPESGIIHASLIWLGDDAYCQIELKEVQTEG